MQGFKEFLESLQKMTDVRLNIAILITCVASILISPADHFILDPVPKIIPQSLILITSIRVVFSIINLMHTIISRTMEKRKSAQQELIENQKKEQEEERSREQIDIEFNNLDVHQLYIIKKLIGKNHSSHAKGATLFSLCNLKITYVVATGEHSQSVALTRTAKYILNKNYNNDISQLEKNSATRAFNSMTKNELDCFKLLLEKELIKTSWSGRDGRTQYSSSHDLFKSYSNSIMFDQPQKGYAYSLNPRLIDVLNHY